MTVKRVMEIVKSAGQIALDRYKQDLGELKEDGTWITPSDKKVEGFLREKYDDLFEQDAHIFGEEGGWTGRKSARYVVIIDPIEGTGPYRDQIPVWGVSVGIFRDGNPWLGLFYMPAAGHLFFGEFGEHGLSARRNEEALVLPNPTLPIPGTSYLGVSSDAHHWDLREYPGKIRAFGASGSHVALVAAGALQAALLTRFNFYDIAATAIILWAAGGALYYLSGDQVSPDEIIELRKPREAVLACHPGYFEETRKHIQRYGSS